MSRQLSDVDRDTLSEVAQLATECSDLRIDNWESTVLSVQGRRTIVRFTGTGDDGVSSRPWSVVLKQITAPENAHAPDAVESHWAFWEREYLLYESGIPQSLTGVLRAPRCFGTRQPASDRRWIWLEDLYDRFGGVWPLEYYAQTAYHLGRFNGAYLANAAFPQDTWFAKHALRSRSTDYITDFDRYRDPSLWKHPLLRQAYPESVFGALDRLAADQERFLEIVDSLPQTFCHLDAWHGNMAAVVGTDACESTVLFDWALAGYGAPGQEIANLIWAALLEFKVDAQDVDRLERDVFNYYLEGLADAGWEPDPALVRCAYLIKSVLLFGFALEAVDHAVNEGAYEATEQLYGKPIDQLVTQAAQVTYLLIERADELRALLDTLSL